jgi:hypothetical protein
LANGVIFVAAPIKVFREGPMAPNAMPPRDPDWERLEKLVVILTIIYLLLQIEIGWIMILNQLNLIAL